MTAPAPEWRAGRLVYPDAPGICVHLVGTAPGLWCGACDETAPARTWVCDGCMRTVTAVQVADFADYEHVICKECAKR